MEKIDNMTTTQNACQLPLFGACGVFVHNNRVRSISKISQCPESETWQCFFSKTILLWWCFWIHVNPYYLRRYVCVCVFFFSLKYAYRASDLLVSKVQRGQIEWPKHTWIFLSKSYNYNSCHGGHFIAHIHHFCWNNKHLKPGNQSKGPKYPVSRVLRSGVCVRSTAHSG